MGRRKLAIYGEESRRMRLALPIGVWQMLEWQAADCELDISAIVEAVVEEYVEGAEAGRWLWPERLQWRRRSRRAPVGPNSSLPS